MPTRGLIAIAAATLAAVLSPAEVRAEWREFKSAKDSFSVQFPGKAETRSQTVKDATGAEIEIRNYGVKEGQRTYVVMVADLPPGTLQGQDPARALEQRRDKTILQTNGRLLEDRELKLEGHPGREFLVETTTKVFLRVRVYLVKERLYQVLLQAPERAEATSKDADKFVGSFKLVKK